MPLGFSSEPFFISLSALGETLLLSLLLSTLLLFCWEADLERDLLPPLLFSGVLLTLFLDEWLLPRRLSPERGGEELLLLLWRRSLLGLSLPELLLRLLWLRLSLEPERLLRCSLRGGERLLSLLSLGLSRPLLRSEP